MNEATERVRQCLKFIVALILSLGMEAQRGDARTDVKKKMLPLCMCQGRVWLFEEQGEKNREQCLQ